MSTFPEYLIKYVYVHDKKKNFVAFSRDDLKKKSWNLTSFVKKKFLKFYWI